MVAEWNVKSALKMQNKKYISISVGETFDAIGGWKKLGESTLFEGTTYSVGFHPDGEIILFRPCSTGLKSLTSYERSLEWDIAKFADFREFCELVGAARRLKKQLEKLPEEEAKELREAPLYGLNTIEDLLDLIEEARRKGYSLE